MRPGLRGSRMKVGKVYRFLGCQCGRPNCHEFDNCPLYEVTDNLNYMKWAGHVGMGKCVLVLAHVGRYTYNGQNDHVLLVLGPERVGHLLVAKVTKYWKLAQ